MIKYNKKEQANLVKARDAKLGALRNVSHINYNQKTKEVSEKGSSAAIIPLGVIVAFFVLSGNI